MARLKVDGLESLTYDLKQVANLPEDVVTGILAKQAELIYNAVRAEAAKLRAGYGGGDNRRDRDVDRRGAQRRSYGTGKTMESVEIAPEELDKKSQLLKMDVYFKGTRKRGEKRVANKLIAFMNEYGSRNINARSFVRKAVASVESAVAKIAEEGIDAWLKKNDL